MEQIGIKQTTPLHQEWLRRLDFYHFELFILQEQLEEIADYNRETDILKKVGYFKNRLSIRKNYIERLRDRIRENDNALTDKITGDDSIENTLETFEALNTECIMEQQLVNNLKRELNRFVAEFA
ncbi:hypothetical protein [Mucilaginibacter celer]|uniref:Uncharacterized protein n=1 Tax=Mucilaginibacter celer TaxID=2305508 RepID=A0A494VLH0_9SPHI|nr:hypothetical protein [Mucilaginibacter celer]AYL94939.1 hypothetical protein HYN43_006350 [Mucilaginibacter celer]